MFTYVLLFVHTFIVFNKYILLCAHFSPKSLYTSQQTAPYCPPLLTIQAARGPQSGFSFLDSDTARWQKWINSRACHSGDGVPGTLRFLCSHGTHVYAHMEPVRTWNLSLRLTVSGRPSVTVQAESLSAAHGDGPRAAWVLAPGLIGPGPHHTGNHHLHHDSHGTASYYYWYYAH
jgi:hypothetical protein